MAHAQASAAFAAPTVNGYKRYRAYTLAPDRAIWARDNRGVMVRVLGEPGDPSTHLENRVGEPAANPYLYMASQIYAGLDGMAKKSDPGPSADTPYETQAPLLPKSLSEALAALAADTVFKDGFGEGFRRLFHPAEDGGGRSLHGGSRARQGRRGYRLGAERIFRYVLRITRRRWPSARAPR